MTCANVPPNPDAGNRRLHPARRVVLPEREHAALVVGRDVSELGDQRYLDVLGALERVPVQEAVVGERHQRARGRLAAGLALAVVEAALARPDSEQRRLVERVAELAARTLGRGPGALRARGRREPGREQQREQGRNRRSLHFVLRR